MLPEEPLESNGERVFRPVLRRPRRVQRCARLHREHPRVAVAFPNSAVDELLRFDPHPPTVPLKSQRCTNESLAEFTPKLTTGSNAAPVVSHTPAS